MAQPITPLKSTTQKFLEIEDIVDDLLILTDGSCALILRTTAVNFDLLSSQEQEVRILAYAGFLNSLTFPIQIVIRSEKKDVSSYLHLLEQYEEKQKNPTLANRIKSYRAFVSETVKERNVLDKKFYVVIPFSILEMGTGHVGTLMKTKKLPYPKASILEKAKTILFPRRDHVVHQVGRFGLTGQQLTTRELIELFYDVYHPGLPHEVAKAIDNKQAIL